MDKSNLLVIESIISERYISAPKTAKKTQRGYLRDVIEGTIMGMQTETETKTQ